MSSDNRKTILLVEDEAIIGMTQKMILENYGYRVIEAGSGEKAIEIVETVPDIDLILMDINLSRNGIDGTEAAKIILQKHVLPLVFISSYTNPEIIEKTEGITSYGFIAKNAGETVLAASIRMAFRLFEANRNLREKQQELEAANEELERANEEMARTSENIETSQQEVIVVNEALRERVKELNCLYDISRIVEKPGISLDETLREIAQVIPAAWQYPEIACARLLIDGKEFRTGNFRETPWRQEAEIKVNGMRSGAVQVCYLEERPATYEGPFLKEERLLIDAIAERAGHIIERVRAEEEREETLKELYRRAKDFEFLYLGAKYLLEEHDFKITARRIFDAVRDMTGAQSGYIALLNPDSSENEVLFLESGGLPCSVDSSLPMPVRGLRGEAYRTGLPAVDNDFMNGQWASLMPAGHVRLDNVLFAPLNIEGKTVGVMGLANKPGCFTVEDIGHAGLFGQLAAIALRNSRDREALRQSEERYRSIVENSNDAIYIHNFKGDILDLNGNACRMLGYTRDELEGANMRKIESGETFSFLPERIERLLVEDMILFEGIHVSKDGLHIPVEISAKVVSREGNGLIQSFVRDITNRKLAERELQGMQSLLGETGRLAKVGGWEFETATLEQVWTEEVYRIHEVELDYIPTVEKGLDFYAPGSRPVIELAVMRAIEYREPFDLELEFITAKGNRRWVRIAGKAHRENGKTRKVSGIFQDITGRRQAEDALRESGEKYRLLHEAAGIGIGYYTVDGVVISYNQLASKHMGGRPEDFNGKSIYDIFPRESAEFYHNRIKKAALSSVPEVYEDFVPLPSGDRQFISTFTKITDSDNKIFGIQIISQDITERWQAEEKIKSLLAEKEVLLREVHHRIKNNMITLRSLLVLHAGAIKNPETISVLQDVQNRILSMITLYDKLYRSDNFIDIPAGEYISSLVDDIISTFPDTKKLKIGRKIDDIILNTRVLFPLGIIINELITNAMKYAFNGRDSRSIDVSLSRKNGSVKLVIHDNGMGMADDKKSKGFGLKLVEILTGQLNGKFKMEQRNGTRCTLAFKI